MSNIEPLTACFTGRRPKDLYGYEHDAYIPLVENLKHCVRLLHEQYGVRRFISGGAQGVDQLAFWAVNRLKCEGFPLSNIVYVPFKGQDSIWRDTGLFSKKEYALMLKMADDVVYLKDAISKNNKGAIVTALHERNHSMVDKSDIVVGVFPDLSWRDSATKGGTAECLRYAHSQHKTIFQLNYTANPMQYWWAQ